MQKIIFTILGYADIGTEYLAPADLDLILNQKAPHHLANHDDDYGAFFYPPEAKNEAAMNTYAEDCRGFGLSERFIDIMRGLWEQEIPYVRFDASGGNIEGFEPWVEEASAAVV